MAKYVDPEIFDSVANCQSSWIRRAEALFFSAELINKNLNSYDPVTSIKEFKLDNLWVDPQFKSWLSADCISIMLLGLGIECLIKAIFLAQGNDLAKNGSFIGIPSAGAHNLVQLCKQINFQLSEREMDLLNRLSDSIEWGGRYPTPTRHTKCPHYTYWLSSQDDSLASTLIARLRMQCNMSAR